MCRPGNAPADSQPRRPSRKGRGGRRPPARRDHRSAELVLDQADGDAWACAELGLLICTAEQGAGVVRRLSALAALPIAKPLSFDVSLLLKDCASRQTGPRLTAGRAPGARPRRSDNRVRDHHRRGSGRPRKGRGGAGIAIGDDGEAPAYGLPGTPSDRFFTTGAGLAAGPAPIFSARRSPKAGPLERTSTPGTGVNVRLTLARRRRRSVTWIGHGSDTTL